jgi:hypothetical protein
VPAALIVRFHAAWAIAAIATRSSTAELTG